MVSLLLQDPWGCYSLCVHHCPPCSPGFVLSQVHSYQLHPLYLRDVSLEPSFKLALRYITAIVQTYFCRGSRILVPAAKRPKHCFLRTVISNWRDCQQIAKKLAPFPISLHNQWPAYSRAFQHCKCLNHCHDTGVHTVYCKDRF